MNALRSVLVLLLTLVATGTMPLLASSPASVDGCDDGCGDENPATPCDDCAPDCAFCLCCPSRAVSTARFSVRSESELMDEAVLRSDTRPVPRLDGARIFHPPRA